MIIKKSIWVILIIFISACGSPPETELGTMAICSTISPSLERTALRSSTPLPSITPTLSPTPSPTPLSTSTPAPAERITFSPAVVEHRPSSFFLTKISFVNSDGSGLEFPTLFEPYHQDAERVPIGRYLAWSPDGRYLAFDGSDKMGRCENAPNTDCFTTNYGTAIADYSQNVILHHIEDTLTNASWSPDSQSLVLSIEEKGASRGLIGDLYILDVNSGRLNQLTNDLSSDLYPSWSPDGQWIAFVRFDPKIPDCGPMPQVAFSNEKCNLGSLFMIRPDGSDLQLLFESIFMFSNDTWLQVINNAPVWSPDSRWLAFLIKTEGGLNDHSSIAILNVETGEMQVVESQRRTNICLAWSPDGQKLAYSNNHGGYFDIFVWDMKENNSVNLTKTQKEDEIFPVWSLSGAHIAFVAWTDLVIMNADGTNRVLVDDENLGVVLGRPAWQPGVQP